MLKQFEIIIYPISVFASETWVKVGRIEQTFGAKRLRRLIRVIPCVYVLKHAPERVRAVLLESELSCYAFLECALQCVVKVRAAYAQDQPVSWKYSLRLSEV